MPENANVEPSQRLAATAERLVNRAPSRLRGEIRAVANDLRAVDDPAVVTDRAGVIVGLLSNVEGTGDAGAGAAVA